MLEQYKIVRKAADAVSYSVKTNPFITALLEEGTDSMFSVHFLTYLDMVKDKSRVWFLPQSWDAAEMEKVFEKGVRSFIVDNENDLQLLLDYIESNGQKINLLLRMRLKEKTIHTERHFVFGFYSEQVNKLIPLLHKNKTIGQLGIHFHRKTENISEWSLKEELTEIIDGETLKSIDILNIGGGLPVKYKNYNVNVLPYIFGKILELKEWLNENGVKMIIEPGRFIAGPPITLEAEIKNIYNNNIVINCSVYNSAMDTFAAHTRLLVENELEEGDVYTIKGCTPDSLDVFRYRVFLKNPKAGDKIVFLNAGAYTYTTDFCNLEKPETIIID
ncbi:MAG: decarboxylase [Candidatus Aenigmarchaeota archaeon]|nr:decarboxylase [Candidatus Aenigmarchaeota archaeon]